MKKLPLLFIIYFNSVSIFCQKFKYEDYICYADKLYLNTPNAWLRAAKRAIINNEYENAITYLNKSADLGLFNMQLINRDRIIQKINDQPGFRKFAERVERNRELLKDTANLQIITTDIDLFWKAFEKAEAKNMGSVWMNQYIMKGSVGLRTYFDVRIGSETNLINKINAYKTFYSNIKAETEKVRSYVSEIKRSLCKLKTIYEDAIFPPVYIVIGNFSSGGTTDGGAGLLIGIEFDSKIDSSKMTELNPWERSVMKQMSEIPVIVIHELIHDQQKYNDPGNTLLVESVTEGVCDFITYLLYGKTSNDQIQDYGNTHEKQLWQSFKEQMDGTDLSKWLYNSNAIKDRPADLGYFMGFKIAEAYYKNALDKKKAVKGMLEIKDFKIFLDESQYEKKISKQ